MGTWKKERKRENEIFGWTRLDHNGTTSTARPTYNCMVTHYKTLAQQRQWAMIPNHLHHPHRHVIIYFLIWQISYYHHTIISSFFSGIIHCLILISETSFVNLSIFWWQGFWTIVLWGRFEWRREDKTVMNPAHEPSIGIKYYIMHVSDFSINLICVVPSFHFPAVLLKRNFKREWQNYQCLTVPRGQYTSLHRQNLFRAILYTAACHFGM